MFVEEESMTSLGISSRRKQHDLLPIVSVVFQDLSLKFLYGQVNEKARVAGHHLGNDPVFAFFISDIGAPCRQRHADSLYMSAILVDNLLDNEYSREVCRALVDPRGRSWWRSVANVL